MNWADELERRRKAYQALCRAQQLAVQAGDRIAVITLGDRVKFLRYRLGYAAKMAKAQGGRAAAWPGFLATDGARFATSPEQAPSCDGAKAGQP
jgi:hypothetical protein